MTPRKIRFLILFVAVVSLALSVQQAGLARQSSPGPQNALRFDGATQYVTFGNPASLGLKTFTLETWFKWEGTGSGGVNGGGVPSKLSTNDWAIPLIAKGSEWSTAQNNSNRDFNYFLGILTQYSTAGNQNKLIVEFEDGVGATAPGTKRPLVGTTVLQTNTWYHAAAIYDGTTLGLYLNGKLESQVVVGTPPRSDSMEPATIATAFVGNGTNTYPFAPSGFFQGVMDEVRIWNVARTADEIKGGICQEIASAAGLVGRWSLNEGTGNTAADSSGSNNTGTLVGPTWVVPSDAPLVAPVSGNYALDLGGTDAFVALGDPAKLSLPVFTLETWFKREAPGLGTRLSTRVTAVPLIAKGRDSGLNYFLGITTAGGTVATDRLVADFEEGSEGSWPGSNHEVVGTTTIAVDNSTWHHAAAAYDGNTWRLYLDGNFEGQADVGEPVNSASTAHVALGSALGSNGTPNPTSPGYFAGAIDEARIWKYARSQAEIQATQYLQVSAATGLVARWGLDEGCCYLVADTTATPASGTIVGANYRWIGEGLGLGESAAPILAPTGNQAPVVDAGPDQAAAVGDVVTLAGLASDDGGSDALTIAWTKVRGAGQANFAATGTAATTISFSEPGIYVVRLTATDAFGATSSDEATITVTGQSGGSGSSLDLGTAQAYVALGNPTKLGLPTFTIETWFNQQGQGIGTSTGGFAAIVPLVTKGRGEADANNKDINYFLGIDTATGAVAADFEVGCADPANCSGVTTLGQNNPVTGATTIQDNTWYHAAVTYDGRVFRVYLNGLLEGERIVAAATQEPVSPRWDSLQPAAIGSAVSSTNAAKGHFNGLIDEVRIWNRPLSLSEIQANVNSQAPNGTGLVARWGLDEGTGTTVGDSVGVAAPGTIIHNGAVWTGSAPFNLEINNPPSPPSSPTPADRTADVGLSPTLNVNVSDLDGDPLTVTFYGRKPSTTAPDFTLAVLPDTQYYVSTAGAEHFFSDQTAWIASQQAARNIAYVAHVGDVSLDGDTYENQWQLASAAMALLEPTSSSLPYGIPYGVAIGNHDETPNGNPLGTTTFFNKYFGTVRFQGRGYFGGHFPEGSNNNHYELFSAAGLDFIVVYLEYYPGSNPLAVAWAKSILLANADRRAIVVSHALIGVGNPGVMTTQGQRIYDALKVCPNLFLMLAGHAGEGQRQDTYQDRTVYTLMSDYQDRPNGGGGLLRILTFSPSSSQIAVETYSPSTNTWETDGDSQFMLGYDMQTVPFDVIGTATVASGATASVTWPDPKQSGSYQWYVTVTDSRGKMVKGPIWNFSTVAALPSPENVTAIATSPYDVTVSWSRVAGATGYAVERSSGTSWEVIGTTADTIYHDGGLSPTGTYQYRVYATNDAGKSLPSATASVTTPPGIPRAPTNLTGMSMSASQIDLHWTGVIAASGYLVERSTNGTTFSAVTSAAAGVSTFSNSALAAATTYWYRVAATSGYGTSSYSNIASATTRTNAPGSFKLTNITYSQVRLTWNDVTGETSYRVERTTGALPWAAIATLPASTTSPVAFTDTTVTPSTAYSYRVIAVNAGGDSAPSAARTATTSTAPAPAPANLNVTGVTATTVTLAWDNVTGETGYRIERSTNGGASFVLAGTTGANVTTFNDTRLFASTSYTYRVMSTSTAGNSQPSNLVTVNTLVDTVAPTTPTNLRASGGTRKITLQWTASRDEGGGSITYDIYRNAAATGAFSLIGTSTSASYTNSGLTKGQTFWYYVVARDSAGLVSAQSNTASATAK